jgi:hypothetical protein
LATRWVVGGQGCCRSLHHDGGGRAQAGITRGEQCVCVCVRVCVMGGGSHVSRICVQVVCGQSIAWVVCVCVFSVCRCARCATTTASCVCVCVCLSSPVSLCRAPFCFLALLAGCSGRCMLLVVDVRARFACRDVNSTDTRSAEVLMVVGLLMWELSVCVAPSCTDWAAT